MNNEDSNMAANAIAHAASMASAAIQNVAYSFERPCLLLKPRLFADGNPIQSFLRRSQRDRRTQMP